MLYKIIVWYSNSQDKFQEIYGLKRFKNQDVKKKEKFPATIKPWTIRS